MKLLLLIQMAVGMLAASWPVVSLPLNGQQDVSPRQAPSTIKVDTNLVLLNVAVTDQKGRAVSGLEKTHFKVFEDGVEHSINFFSMEKVPVSWALVLDRSGSMSEMIGNVYRAAVHVVDEGSEDDEAFIVTFSETSELASDFVSDRRKLRDSVEGLRAGGSTALWDAVAFALDHLKHGQHRKKVMVVITDGEDNHSRLNLRDLVRRVEEEDVLIYTVGMFESDGLSRFFGADASMRKQLARLAEATGAQAHFPTNIEQCEAAMAAIARDVSWQYQLGYYPTNRARDGKWRKIKVIVVGSGNTDTKYIARTRTGYYGPTS
jgi:VWFA-related protein